MTSHVTKFSLVVRSAIVIDAQLSVIMDHVRHVKKNPFFNVVVDNLVNQQRVSKQYNTIQSKIHSVVNDDVIARNYVESIGRL